MSDLPKQWRHWCRTNGLKISGRRKSKYARQFYSWYNLVGHDRRWRINDRDMLQRGDTLEDFDRWANSGIIEVPMPKTKLEFDAAIRAMKDAPEPEEDGQERAFNVCIQALKDAEERIGPLFESEPEQK